MNRTEKIDWMDKGVRDELPEMREKYEPVRLPSRYWEPELEEEDLARMEREYEGSELDDEPFPFD